MAVEADIVVIGAGVAGLSAAERLRQAGRRVVVLEARERTGGRICTLQVPDWPFAVELGAEFIHGSPSEFMRRVRQAGCQTETMGAWSPQHNWHWQNGTLTPAGEFGGGIDRVMERLNAYDTSRRDVSFLEFLATACGDLPESAHRAALGYIEGFEAADPTRIGLRGLQRESRAEDESGWTQHRLQRGYHCLLESLQEGADVRLEAPVRHIRWAPGRACVRVEAKEEPLEYTARCVLITVPLCVLQQGLLAFEPALVEKKTALEDLVMGQARRAVVRLRRPIWQQARDIGGRTLRGLRFLFGSSLESGHFVTWWTAASGDSGPAQITGWAAGRHAMQLAGQSDAAIRARALQDLSERLGLALSAVEREVEGVETFDWQAATWIGGAYSYAGVGGENAAALLAQPVAETLYFAGEATESTGHHATVHGAMQSGWRAADEILHVRAQA